MLPWINKKPRIHRYLKYALITFAWHIVHIIQKSYLPLYKKVSSHNLRPKTWQLHSQELPLKRTTLRFGSDSNRSLSTFWSLLCFRDSKVMFPVLFPRVLGRLTILLDDKSSSFKCGRELKVLLSTYSMKFLVKFRICRCRSPLKVLGSRPEIELLDKSRILRIIVSIKTLWLIFWMWLFDNSNIWVSAGKREGTSKSPRFLQSTVFENWWHWHFEGQQFTMCIRKMILETQSNVPVQEENNYQCLKLFFPLTILWICVVYSRNIGLDPTCFFHSINSYSPLQPSPM